MTVVVNLKLEGDGAFAEEFKDREIVRVADGTVMYITGLEGGMASGKPSVAFAFNLPDGRFVFAQTSLAMLLTVADALRGRYGDPRR